MTTPQDVLDQAMRMVTGSRVERARAGMSALTLFGQLPPDDKRDLAVLVAQRVAPDLVPRIQAETGMDLTVEQSRAVLDMVGRLDGEDVAELQASLGSPDARRAALGSVATAAATATGVDDVVGTRGGRGTTTPGRDDPRARELARESSERHAARVRMLEERIEHLTEELGQAQIGRSEAEARARSAEVQVQSSVSRAEEAERRVTEQLEAATRARAEARQAEEEARQARDRVRRIEVQGVAGHLGSGRTPDHRHRVGHGATADVLAARLRQGSAAQALRLLVTVVPAVAAMSPQERLHTIVAIPDGWARRRAIQRLVERGAVTPDEVGSLLATLAGVGDQVFTATTFIEAGLATVDDLATITVPAVATRLRLRRSAA